MNFPPPCPRRTDRRDRTPARRCHGQNGSLSGRLLTFRSPYRSNDTRYVTHFCERPTSSFFFFFKYYFTITTHLAFGSDSFLRVHFRCRATNAVDRLLKTSIKASINHTWHVDDTPTSKLTAAHTQTLHIISLVFIQCINLITAIPPTPLAGVWIIYTLHGNQFLL